VQQAVDESHTSRDSLSRHPDGAAIRCASRLGLTPHASRLRDASYPFGVLTATDCTWRQDLPADLTRVAWRSESDLGTVYLRQDASVIGPAQPMTVSLTR